MSNDELKKMETIDLNNVPIFSTGVWEGRGSPPGGSKIDGKFLKSIVESFNKVGNKVKPRLRISHDQNKSTDFTGMASLGWITNLREDGQKLFADIKQIPKKVAELIQKKAFGRFSPGIWEVMNINGKNFSNILDHVALLGAELPANMDLDGFIDLYEYTENDELICYTNKIQEVDMDLEKRISELESQLVDFQKKENNFNLENEKLKKEIKGFQKDKVELENRVEDYKKKEIEIFAKEVDNFIENSVKEGKITVANAPLFKALAEKKDAISFSYNENNEKKVIEGSSLDIVKSIINNQPNLEFGNIESDYKKVEKGSNEEDKLDAKIKEYARDHKISYSEAYDKVAEEAI